jgi:single-strand DNA-binding protein
MNIVQLIGRTTKDIELKYTQSSKAYCKFTLAINRKYNKEETDFINCMPWNKTAELIAKYVNKGDKMACIGWIQTGSYDGQDGKRVYTTEVVCENIEFLETKKQDEYHKSNTNDVGLGVDKDLPF